MTAFDPRHPRRVLVTGGAGLLGQALIDSAPPGIELHATQRHTPVSRAESTPLDLADDSAVHELWRALRPDLVIHTAYGTARPERDLWQATRNVVAATQRVGAQLIHLSTDALFDGHASPYDESAPPTPIFEYGRWKARLEQHLHTEMPGAAIIRTSLLTRAAPLDERSAWVANALRRGEPLTLFVDELRMPITPGDLARQLWEIAALPPAQQGGVWHLVGPELLSRYALGLLIAAHQRLDPAGITPTLARDHPSPRPRVLHLLTARADRMLHHRPRTISAEFAPSPEATVPG